MRRAGLTLIELLLVMGILAILVAIVLIALDPSKGEAGKRDAARTADVETILTAVFAYANEHGDLPDGIPEEDPGEICQTGKACEGIDGAVELDMLIGADLKALPIDPTAVGEGTGYFIVENQEGIVTVSAPDAERGEIKVSR